MSKINKRGGFTLAELLIVIAIIAILIAIAIPAFSTQLENAKLQADHANLRSAYALVQTANVVGGTDAGITAGSMYSVSGGVTSDTAAAVTLQAAGKHKAGTASCDACVVNCAAFTTGNNHIYFVKGSDDYSWKLGTAATTAVADKSTPAPAGP